MIFNVLDITLSAIAIYFSFTAFKKRNHDILLAEKYKNLIFPLFDVTEPYLRNESPRNSSETFKKILHIYHDNKVYASTKMREAIRTCSSTGEHFEENFLQLCKLIQSEYDSCCTKLGIKNQFIKHMSLQQNHKLNLHRIFYATVSFVYSIIIPVLISFVFSTLLGLIIQLLQQM